MIKIKLHSVGIVLLLKCVIQVQTEDGTPEGKSDITFFPSFDIEYSFNLYPCTDLYYGNPKSRIFRETELQRKVENPYPVFINYEFGKGSNVSVTFGAPANVYYTDLLEAHVESISEYTIVFKFHTDSEKLPFVLEKTNPSIVPYVEGIVINGTEFCRGQSLTVRKYKHRVRKFFGIIDYALELYKSNVVPISLPATQPTCGTKKVHYTELIVNGFPTKPGDWPWHAAMYEINWATSVYICGGTLISESFVLTAAHCVVRNGSPVLPETRGIVLGKYYLRAGDETAVQKDVEKIIVHEMYDIDIQRNDIAVLKLSSSIEFNDYIQPACLWQIRMKYKLPADTSIFGTVVGWGINQTGNLSNQLQQVDIPMVDSDLCANSSSEYFGKVLDKNSFCAGFRNGTSACNGDSGGGFVIQVEDRYYVRGIVSTTIANGAKCDPNYYVLFTDVEKYLTWIHNEINL